jgi:hypothetical protein
MRSTTKGVWIRGGVPGAIAALSINTCPSVTAHPARLEAMAYRGHPGAVSDDVGGERGREGQCRLPWPMAALSIDAHRVSNYCLFQRDRKQRYTPWVIRGY